MTVTFGADPEYLVTDRQGQVVPICGLLGGEKGHAIPFPSAAAYSYHEDCVAAELNIPPATTPGQAVRHVTMGVNLLRELLDSRNLLIYEHPGYDFDGSITQIHQAMTAGCDPDYDAYLNGAIRPSTNIFNESLFRGVGGHIHLGGDFNCPPFVAALFMEAAYLGSGALPAHPSAELVARSRWYGAGGSFRPKPYGVEYRTPDNQWTLVPEKLHAVTDSMICIGDWLVNSTPRRIKAAMDSINWFYIRARVGYHKGYEWEATVAAAGDMISVLRRQGVPI